MVEFAKRHTRERFAPMFVALQDAGPPATEIESLGCPVHALDMARVGKRETLRQLRALLRTHGAEVVHTHNTYAHFYGERKQGRGAYGFGRRPGAVRLRRSSH